MSSGLASTNGSSLTLNGYITTCETGTPSFAGDKETAGASSAGEDWFARGLRLGADLVVAAREAGEDRQTYIYFIQAGRGAVKVGVAKNPLGRLTELQTGNHEVLRLRAAFRGPARLERIIHRHFADSRLAGEWFQPSDDLLALADCLREYALNERHFCWDDGPLIVTLDGWPRPIDEEACRAA